MIMSRFLPYFCPPVSLRDNLERLVGHPKPPTFALNFRDPVACAPQRRYRPASDPVNLGERQMA